MQPEPQNPSGAVLEARGLVKRFGPVTAVAGVSLEVHAGRVTAILGPSGSGKSTLLRCLNFLEIPDEGEVRFAGRPVRARDADLNGLRSRVGMVFQQFNLFPHLRVWENVALAPRVVRNLSRSTARGLALDLLDRVGLTDKADAHPAQLSGGSSSAPRSRARSRCSRPRSSSTSRPRPSTLDRRPRGPSPASGDGEALGRTGCSPARGGGQSRTSRTRARLRPSSAMCRVGAISFSLLLHLEVDDPRAVDLASG
jgi:predicted ABC-type transport system involved in lysophospholipase L1 biosynthesis ATPase subunit